jgi:hypothetical protein
MTTMRKKLTPALVRTYYALLAAVLVSGSDTAWAQVAGLDGLVAKIQQFNGSLVLVGSALTVTGLIWALMSFTLGLAGGAKAIMCLIGGLGIAVAPQIVGFVTGTGG